MEENEALVPYSGEVVNLDDPPACLKLLVEIRDLEGKLRGLKDDLSEALKLEFSRQGTKTLEMNGIKATLGALRALFETDLKRVLAYSTVSALGILMLLFGAGTPEAVTAGFAYLLAHACSASSWVRISGGSSR